MQIIHYPHPTLRHISKPLKRVDAELQKMVREMFDLMYQAKGVGLAANQVDLPYRLFVANLASDPAARDEEHVFINPVIRGRKGMAEAEEGCLSLPSVYEMVRRPETVTINAYTLGGQEVDWELSGLFARVVQHETDHLDGVLFIDRLPATKQADMRGVLEEFAAVYENRQALGEMLQSQANATRLSELERLRT